MADRRMQTVEGISHSTRSLTRQLADMTFNLSYQAVSLHKGSKATDEGIQYPKPDNPAESVLFTPEDSIAIQHAIGADIILQLDDVTASSTANPSEAEEATSRSIKWLDRSLSAHDSSSTQILYATLQGGSSLQLRASCTRQMLALNPEGYAIAGLPNAQSKYDFCSIIATHTSLLPADKPRHAIGVGFPEDILVAIALGVDTFDSTYPTRMGRFGTALTSRGKLDLRHALYAEDFRPIEEGCRCIVCAPEGDGPGGRGLGMTRAGMWHLAGKETVGASLVSLHNVSFLSALVQKAREATLRGYFVQFLKSSLASLYESTEGRYPVWMVETLGKVGIDLMANK